LWWNRLLLEELTELLTSLGERPSADGTLRRGPYARADARAAPSAALSEVAPRELGGLGRTGALARVAPCEFMLLAGEGHARRRRKLFLSRLVGRQLLGYNLEGWAEASARPLSRRSARLPR